MPTKPLVLVAASGLAREVVSSVRASVDRMVIGFLDDDVLLHGTSVSGLPVLGGLAAAEDHPDAEFVVCVGSGRTRSVIVDRLSQCGIGDDRFATLIDPSVRVPTTCNVGVGSILLAQTVLTANVEVGRHVVVMPHVVLTHDDRVDDFATLCAGVVLGGGVRVGRLAYLGMNACVREKIHVGANAVLGMGATLLTDLPEAQTWAGVPARDLAAAHVPTASTASSR
ncbi:NeuD/PglB/VioB family sugar acetyltransferase [Rhodococcus sp. NPDC127528]|uniref:NeuD/PglB/VioB family sugar acetyltransferase n=1 Tax=unclassified Rhodococcus (in: high G+C Gram-positive bacteria) TaxID=192944 RepID=UPI003629517B